MNKRNPSLFPMAGFLTVGVIPGWDKGNIMLRSIGSVTFLALLMVGCGGGGGDSGGGGGGAPTYTVGVTVSGPTYTVGGTVSGLVGSGLTLGICPASSNRGPPKPCYSVLQIVANGAFTLPSDHPAFGTVIIAQQPSSPTQRCVISSAAALIQDANDHSVTVYCAEYSYVTNATDNTLSAYSIDATTGALAVIGAPTVTGASPYAIVGFESFVYVGNEGNNDVSAFAIDPTTGALTAVAGSPFAAGTDPQAMVLYGSSLYVANAGSDNISVYDIDANTGALAGPFTIATGRSPKSIVVDPEGSQIYVANHGGSNDISEFYSDLTPVPGSPFPAGGNPLSLALGANGKFLYSANPDATNPSISGFSVDGGIGVLSPLSGSPFPLPVSHYIATDQTGAYLYVTSGASVLGYGIDAATGALTPLPGFPVAAGANAYSITVDPTNQFLYVTNDGTANVSGFTLDASTGALTPMSGSPFPAGNHPKFIATF
jgi:6-phosphogluconolactonase (cycloisomerase 2 family)